MSLQSSLFGDFVKRKGNASRFICALALIASASLAATAFAAPSKEAKRKLEEVMSHDGLEKVAVEGLDLVYVRPGASLANYSKVQLDPVEVSFHKDWDPKQIGTLFKLSASDREKIRTGVAKVVYEEFVKELQTKSSYQVVEASGPDVLRVKVIIANLYVTAPDVPTAGRSRTYVSNAGEMTLIAELYDSESGQVLARVVDRDTARDYMIATASNSVFNVAEARNIASGWGRALRESLDRAHGIGKK